jgi:hypothetical protein
MEITPPPQFELSAFGNAKMAYENLGFLPLGHPIYGEPVIPRLTTSLHQSHSIITSNRHYIS